MARKKKTSFMKKVLLAVIVCAVAIALGVTLLYRNLDSIIRSGVERGLGYVLQVEVSLERVKVTVSEGSIELSGLQIGNPEGFKTQEAFSVDVVRVQADVKSLGKDPLVIHRIEVQSPHITLEQGLGQSNLDRLMESASRFGGEKKGEKGKGSKEAEKTLRIDDLVIDGARVAVSTPALQGKGLSIPLGRVHLENLGSEGEPVTAAEAIRQVIAAILSETLSSGAGKLPGELVQGLQGSVNLGAQGLDKSVDLLKDTGAAVGNGLKSLFGGKKKGDEE